MSPRSLFNLILKVIGIFFIKDILESFSHTLSALVYVPQYTSVREAIFNVAVTFPALILYCLLTWLFIFRSDSIVKILKLDKSFGESAIQVNFERRTILRVAIIFAGGWILINEIPEFFRHAMYYYQERKMYVRMTRPDVSYILMSSMKILIGILLVLFHRQVVFLVEFGNSNRPSVKRNKNVLINK